MKLVHKIVCAEDMIISNPKDEELEEFFRETENASSADIDRLVQLEVDSRLEAMQKTIKESGITSQEATEYVLCFFLTTLTNFVGINIPRRHASDAVKNIMRDLTAELLKSVERWHLVTEEATKRRRMN
jgi:hypothetical protein